MWAVEKGRKEVVQKILDMGVNMESTDSDGWTIVMYAARRGNVPLCELVLHYGADLNASTGEDGFTPLHLACGNELTDMGCALTTAKDSDGKTPFKYCKTAKVRETMEECATQTYKEGKTASQIHKSRTDSATDRSITNKMNKYTST